MILTAYFMIRNRLTSTKGKPLTLLQFFPPSLSPLCHLTFVRHPVSYLSLVPLHMVPYVPHALSTTLPPSLRQRSTAPPLMAWFLCLPLRYPEGGLSLIRSSVIPTTLSLLLSPQERRLYRPGTQMRSLTDVPPRIDAKRYPCRAPPGLGCKSQSILMPLRPVVAWHHGSGNLSHV